MKLQSQCITSIRFPLSVAVVFIHATVIEVMAADTHVFPYIFHLISDGVVKVAVPLFFAMSAWLFFISGWTWHGYASKLRRRVRTLLVPYIIWNILYIAVWYAAQQTLPSLISGHYTAIRDYSPTDFLRCFWNILGGQFPINGALWFIRNLIIFNLLAPVFYYTLRYAGRMLIPVLTVLYVLGIGSEWFISMESIYFYALGAWLAVSGLPLFRPLNHGWAAGVAWASLLAASLWWHEVRLLAILTGCIYISHTTYRMTERGYGTQLSALAGCSFFIFAYHMLPNALIGKLTVRLFGVSGDVGFLLSYLFLVTATTLLGVALYHIGHRICPRAMSVLCGGRAV